LSKSVRLLELTNLLSAREVRLDEIVRRFGISERTAYRDLADLGYSSIPITRGERGYKLVEGSTLRPLNLDARERAVLKLALGNPSLRKLAPLRKTLQSLEAKLDAATRRVEETPEALRLATLDTSGPNAEAALDPLETAIRAQRRVEIHYASLSGGTKEWRAVDPWRVFERAAAWYLVGHCLKNREPRIFRLDRISGVRTATSTTPPFTPPGDFDLDTYLRDAWRVFVGRERHDIVLRFAPRLAPLILNAEHHAGEEKKELRDGSVEYRVSLSSLEEIARWVVGFGGGVEVVRPQDLGASVRQLGREPCA
jgi:predicted DNA-binding transcriptional regulator YafY